MSYFVYILRAKDNSLYTGFTVNIEERIKKHNSRIYGAKSLRGRLPVTLVYSESYKTKSKALKREAEIKSWKKDKKERLIDFKRESDTIAT